MGQSPSDLLTMTMNVFLVVLEEIVVDDILLAMTMNVFLLVLEEIVVDVLLLAMTMKDEFLLEGWNEDAIRSATSILFRVPSSPVFYRPSPHILGDISSIYLRCRPHIGSIKLLYLLRKKGKMFSTRLYRFTPLLIRSRQRVLTISL